MRKAKWLKLILIILLANVTILGYGGSCGTSGSNKDTTTGSSAPATPTPPVQVTSPTPANNATGVITTTQLSWASASGAASYDVYCGITTTGWTPVTNTILTAFSSSALSYSTTYYWRIDSKNSAGTTTGNIWSFQTESSPVIPPAQVTSPNPVDGSTNVPITQQLGWATVSGATSYMSISA